MIKIQGTDGIRGYIEQKPLSVSETGQRNPLKIFLEKNILIPEFFELYAYGFCQYLLQEKLAKKRDYIMVGKDTRDTDFRYTQACLDGIKKAKAGVGTMSKNLKRMPAFFMPSKQA